MFGRACMWACVHTPSLCLCFDILKLHILLDAVSSSQYRDDIPLTVSTSTTPSTATPNHNPTHSTRHTVSVTQHAGSLFTIKGSMEPLFVPPLSLSPILDISYYSTDKSVLYNID